MRNTDSPNIHVSETGSRLFYGYIIVIAAFFILLVAYGARFAYGVFFKPMAGDLGFDSATTAAAYSISYFLEGIFSLVSGGLADRFGPRIVITLSSILVVLGYGLMYFVHSTWQLYLFYGIFIGVGMGAMFVPLISMVARWFNARRNLMTGLVSSGAGVGLLIVPRVTAGLIERFDWRVSFVIIGIFLLVVIMTAAQFLKRDPSKIGAVPHGETRNPTTGRAAATAGYSFQEALRIPQFWLIFAMVFWYGFYSMSINVHIVPDAISSGMTATLAANILATSGALMITGRIVLGLAADKTGNKAIFLLGFILSSFALFTISFHQAYWVFFFMAVLLGFSQGGIGISQSSIVASLFGLKSHGLIYGCVGFGFTMGAALGPYITGLIFDRTGSYNIAFLICGGASLLSLLITILITPIKDSRILVSKL